TLGASDDGTLVLDRGVALTERATLQVGLSGSGTDVQVGLIQITGQLEQMGTLELVLDASFDANLGDEFTILTASNGFAGTFDDFQGFNIGNGKAFEYFALDATSGALRVIEEVEAPAGADVFDFV
ncbi:MAG: hypothetical protein AAF092_16020, partial [Pseudomonadota bacterium]